MSPDTWREGMKTRKVIRTPRISIRMVQNGKPRIRDAWKWAAVGAVICWPIASGLSYVALLAIRARDVGEIIAAIIGTALFWVVLPVYTFRMGRIGEGLMMGWEKNAPEGPEEQE